MDLRTLMLILLLIMIFKLLTMSGLMIPKSSPSE